MSKFLITRRALLKAGLATSMAALIPSTGFSGSVVVGDLQPIGSGAEKNSPYKNTTLGDLSDTNVKLISDFSRWAINAWQFKGMDEYPTTLESVLNLKTNQLPSYLSEYQNAAQLISETKNRLNSEYQAFIYLMFVGRDSDDYENSRLRRAQNFVFDEIVTHLVANGGFRHFGFTNYKGYISVSFTEPSSYRRGGI